MTEYVSPWLIIVAIIADALIGLVALERWPPAVYAMGVLIARTLYGNSLAVAIMCVAMVALVYFLTRSMESRRAS